MKAEEELKNQILKIAEIIEGMHKPEYATFFLYGEQLDGYEFAERINDWVKDFNAKQGQQQ